MAHTNRQTDRHTYVHSHIKQDAIGALNLHYSNCVSKYAAQKGDALFICQVTKSFGWEYSFLCVYDVTSHGEASSGDTRSL